MREEIDSLGKVFVPEDKYWGAQTQRSFENFKIGTEKMPAEIINAIAIIKRAAATVNNSLGVLSHEKAEQIVKVSDLIIEGKLDDNFPLSVWQTGSGTQTNMNVNEVIVNKAAYIYGEKNLNANDDVNKSQSSNDVFPSAINIAAVISIEKGLLPAITSLIDTFKKLEEENDGIIKMGRTHLQDAVPLYFSQEISGWRCSLANDMENIRQALSSIRKLALGGTAVGTGLNAPKDFGEKVAEEISKITGERFYSDNNKFSALSSKGSIVFVHGAIKALASDLHKIANDIRMLASGPRSGLNEIIIPANEPGSSIMPGKVNPTQCEAMTMVALRVIGNDVSISAAGGLGNFQLNVYMPLIAYSFIQSVKLLTDCINSFNEKCAKGIKANISKMKENVNNSLMLVTALNPIIGYLKAAEVSKKAYKENKTLKQACVELGFLSEADFDKIVDPEKMI